MGETARGILPQAHACYPWIRDIGGDAGGFCRGERRGNHKEPSDDFRRLDEEAELSHDGDRPANSHDDDRKRRRGRTG